MQEIYASLKVELPDDPIEASTMLAAITSRWAEMLKQLDMKHVVASLTIDETRNRRAPRKPRLHRMESSQVGLAV